MLKARPSSTPGPAVKATMPESHDDDVYDLLRLPEAAPPVDVYDSLDIDAVTFGADVSRRSLRRFGADEDFDRTRVISGVITSLRVERVLVEFAKPEGQ